MGRLVCKREGVSFEGLELELGCWMDINGSASWIYSLFFSQSGVENGVVSFEYVGFCFQGPRLYSHLHFVFCGGGGGGRQQDLVTVECK